MKVPDLHILKKVGWMGGFTISYFLLVRPMRSLYSEEVVYEMLLSPQKLTGNITSLIPSARKVLITYMTGGHEIGLSYIPQFGFFFLFGLIGLTFFKANGNAYIGLLLFQLGIELLVLFLIWLGIHHTISGFIISEFLMMYLSPLGCLGFVVWASRRERDKFES